MTVETAAPPRALPDAIKIEGGERIVIPWDRPLQRLEYEIEPAVESRVRIDPTDTRVSYIELQNPRQQQEYRVRIVGGEGHPELPSRMPTSLRSAPHLRCRSPRWRRGTAAMG